MGIGILGAGNVGATLGQLWARAGHAIHFGVRHPKKIADLCTRLAARAGTPAEAAGEDVLLLAVPWSAIPDVLATAGDLRGKVLIDPTNALRAGLAGLALGPDTSAAEEIARLAPGARAVKAFNSIGMQALLHGGLVADGYLCGDDASAKELVSGLCVDAGLRPLDCGPLSAARMLEPLAWLWIHLAHRVGLGPNIAFHLNRG